MLTSQLMSGMDTHPVRHHVDPPPAQHIQRPSHPTGSALAPFLSYTGAPCYLLFRPHPTTTNPTRRPLLEELCVYVRVEVEASPRPPTLTLLSVSEVAHSTPRAGVRRQSVGWAWRDGRSLYEACTRALRPFSARLHPSETNHLVFAP